MLRHSGCLCGRARVNRGSSRLSRPPILRKQRHHTKSQLLASVTVLVEQDIPSNQYLLPPNQLCSCDSSCQDFGNTCQWITKRALRHQRCFTHRFCKTKPEFDGCVARNNLLKDYVNCKCCSPASHQAGLREFRAMLSSHFFEWVSLCPRYV